MHYFNIMTAPSEPLSHFVRSVYGLRCIMSGYPGHVDFLGALITIRLPIRRHRQPAWASGRSSWQQRAWLRASLQGVSSQSPLMAWKAPWAVACRSWSSFVGQPATQQSLAPHRQMASPSLRRFVWWLTPWWRPEILECQMTHHRHPCLPSRPRHRLRLRRLGRTSQPRQPAEAAVAGRLMAQVT